MSESDQLLRKKAMLLIRREREVYEYRQERSRTELWLTAFHELSLNLGATSANGLVEQWVASMVGELTFQVAGVHACDPTSYELSLLSAIAPSPMLATSRIDAASYDYLCANPTGTFTRDSSSELSALRDALGLEMFYWMLLPGRGQRLILTAGFVPGTERFRSVRRQDATHFALLGSHLAALLANVELIAALDREKSELSASNRQLDASVRELNQTQSQLLESSKVLAEVSRRAGMADVATGVLHNVGNALNSVNVSAGVIAERLRQLKLEGVSRAAELLTAPGELASLLASDERGQKLAPYLGELGSHLLRERDGMVAEMRSLERHVDHIKAIVGKQQTYAMTVDVSQACLASELADDAMALSETLLTRMGISVTREYAELPELVTDRHKVLQILVNLMSNAKHALTASQQPHKEIRIHVERNADGSGVVIRVCDNGAGIEPENLARLFRYGFTTRKEGHGFGLHTSAIAANELGGTLSAKSAGAGKGAEFRLELPFERPRRQAAE